MSPSDPDVRATPSAARRIGNRYRLEERIGAGAMGTVWRGTDELLNRTVAVKEVHATVAADADDEALEESRQRILREGRIGARLQHPHVISMFDVVLHDDRPWLVMEYLPSQSLAAALGEKGPMSAREAAAVGEQVADGLAAAHAAGVVHRDVKPGNVLLGVDGLAKITDFGVSRAVDDVQLTRTGMIAGTPAYLAPEIARGGQPTAASDVFALGATLYAAVEGQPPFGLDDNAYALLHKVATGAVRPPVAAGTLTPLLARLLAVDPADRPSASQARAELAAVAVGAGPDAPPDRVALFGGPSAPPAFAAPSAPPPVPPAAGPPTLSAVPAPAPDGPSRGTPRWRYVLVAVLAVLVVAAGVLVGVLRSNGSAGDPDTVPPPSSASVPTTTVAPTTTTTPPTTPPTTTTTIPPVPPADGSAVAFVQQYYSLLPGNPDAAFAMLGPGAQEQSGGRDQFRAFYSGMASVSLENARAAGDGEVTGTVVFVRTSGATTRENYRFSVGSGAGGGQVITSFRRG